MTKNNRTHKWVLSSKILIKIRWAALVNWCLKIACISTLNSIFKTWNGIVSKAAVKTQSVKA